jgi:hypothetical protein
MNRRIFAKSVLGTVGLSVIAGPSLATKQTEQVKFEAGHQMLSDEGLKMTLSGHSLPTSAKDAKQFVLTFDVNNPSGTLDEKIYHLTDHNGKKHQMFMSPIDQNQLQAVFNWRTHA